MVTLTLAFGPARHALAIYVAAVLGVVALWSMLIWLAQRQARPA